MKPYCHLFIAEPAGKGHGRVEELKDAVEGTGFCMLGDVEQRYDFVYVTALKG